MKISQFDEFFTNGNLNEVVNLLLTVRILWTLLGLHTYFMTVGEKSHLGGKKLLFDQKLSLTKQLRFT